jgi:hypothetical protein
MEASGCRSNKYWIFFQNIENEILKFLGSTILYRFPVNNTV